MYNRPLLGARAHGDNHWTDTRTAALLFVHDTRTHADREKARRAAGGPSALRGKLMPEVTFGFCLQMTSSRSAPLFWQQHLQHPFPAGPTGSRSTRAR